MRTSVLACTLLVVGCRSSPSAHMLEGVVRDGSGAPLARARIDLTPLAEPTAGGDGALHVTTSATGELAFDRGPGGVQRLTIAVGDQQTFSTLVVLDPADRAAVRLDVQLAEPPAVARAVFDPKHEDEAGLVSVPARFHHDTDELEHGYDAYIAAHGNSRGFAFDASTLRAYLVDQMQHAPLPAVRQLAAGMLIRLHHYAVALSPAELAEIIAVMPADSPMWSIDGELVKYAALGLASDQAASFLHAMIDHNPSRLARAQALLALTRDAYRRGDDAAWRARHAELARQYGDVKPIRFEMRLLDPDAPITRGKPVPAFEAPLLDGGTVSSASLRGRYYLLDFWATWCGPCVGELPALDRAFTTYASKNFMIVSVSLDEDADAVARFRKTAWPMPWLHVFVKAGAQAMIDDKVRDPLAIEFGIDKIGLPRSVLVSPDGIILATQDEVFSEQLDATLARYLAR